MNKCTKKNCPMNAETLNPNCDLKSCPYRTEISGDLISREQAINELKLAYFDKDLQSAKDDPCIVDAMTDWAIRTIKRLPSVTPKARWIPVTEYQPNETGTYIATVKYGDKYAVGQRYYHGQYVGWEDSCVIAWMPFPEPYKAESEEEG